ncbi:MAG: hypothetical protein QNJ46_13535 [Leptolyngbyaceae cyanobacterium MO_188.B28]|nr:hypothetical protein [Leptolyngbyaceae cyanobacterium MO_188.B28]
MTASTRPLNNQIKSAGEQQCLDYLSWAMQQLQVDVAPQTLKQISGLIVQCMTAPGRYFHSLQHSFDVANGGDAIEAIAALFHDLVYVQIDGGVNALLDDRLQPFVQQVRGRLQLRDAAEMPKDPGFELVITLFDVQPGQHLALEQNEFLSALVAVQWLRPILGWAELAQIVACIEATIPFRPPSPTGLLPSDQLYHKLSLVNHQFNLGLTQAEIVQAIQRAVRLINRDVANFADPEAAIFLSYTWRLLPELNPCLRGCSTYSIREYRHALEKTTSFMHFLDPGLIFRQFHDEPSSQHYQDMLNRAHKNLSVACLYLNVKLLAIGILEALSIQLGDTIPPVKLGGIEIPAASHESVWQGRLPQLDAPYLAKDAIEQEVMELLEIGRAQDSNFDIKKSPLAAFLVRYLGFCAVEDCLGQAKTFFQGSLPAEEFLAETDQTLIKVFKEAIWR